MIYGLWQSTAGLQALQLRQDVLANNLANIDTAGFKPDWVTLSERVAPVSAAETLGDGPRVPHPLLDRIGGGVDFSPTHTDFRTAPPVLTDNPLDLAIQGDGFFAVQTDKGVRYTRDGRFSLRADGGLVTTNGGWDVLDTSGRAIRLDRTNGQPIRIDPSGRIRQGAVSAGEIQLWDFADRGQLRNSGGNLFAAGEAEPVEAVGEIRQGAFEASGVDALQGMVRMIEASRAYQMNAQLITMQDQTLSRAVNDVGRLPR